MQRRDFFGLAALPAFPALAALPLFRSDSEPIPNGVVTKDAVHVNQVPGVGESTTYYGGSTEQLKNLSVGTWKILPGTSPHDIHTHPEEELLVFTEGTGEVSISGKRSKVAGGSVMYCAANLPHGVYNTGPFDMLFYFVKWKA